MGVDSRNYRFAPGLPPGIREGIRARFRIKRDTCHRLPEDLLLYAPPRTAFRGYERSVSSYLSYWRTAVVFVNLLFTFTNLTDKLTILWELDNLKSFN